MSRVHARLSRATWVMVHSTFPFPVSDLGTRQSVEHFIMAENDKQPLKGSVNGDEAVDYEALFNREGDQRRHKEKFAAKTAIGEVQLVSFIY